MSLDNKEQTETKEELLDVLFKRIVGTQMQLQTSLPREVAKIHQKFCGFCVEGAAEHYSRLPFSLFRVISILIDRQSVTMSELSEALETPLSTTTGLVDLLVKANYARRLPDPEDRRVVRISLAEEGRQAWQVVNNHFKGILRRIVTRLTVDDIKTLLNISAKFAIE